MGNRTGASFGGKPEVSPRKKGRSPGESELKRRLELNGFKKWWVAGHASSHPLRGDLPTTANVVEWQNAIQPPS